MTNNESDSLIAEVLEVFKKNGASWPDTQAIIKDLTSNFTFARTSKVNELIELLHKTLEDTETGLPSINPTHLEGIMALFHIISDLDIAYRGSARSRVQLVRPVIHVVDMSTMSIEDKSAIDSVIMNALEQAKKGRTPPTN